MIGLTIKITGSLLIAAGGILTGLKIRKEYKQRRTLLKAFQDALHYADDAIAIENALLDDVLMNCGAKFFPVKRDQIFSPVRPAASEANLAVLKTPGRRPALTFSQRRPACGRKISNVFPGSEKPWDLRIRSGSQRISLPLSKSWRSWNGKRSRRMKKKEKMRLKLRSPFPRQSSSYYSETGDIAWGLI